MRQEVHFIIFKLKQIKQKIEEESSQHTIFKKKLNILGK